jgi:hypothetical protein
LLNLKKLGLKNFGFTGAWERENTTYHKPANLNSRQGERAREERRGRAKTLG